MYIPDGYGTVFPYLFVSNTMQYLDFLKRAFDAQILGVFERTPGQVVNARVRIGTTRFMVSEAGERFPPSKSAFYIYVENADASCRQALSAGAGDIMAPMDMPYGDRQGGVTDPAGNIWWISTRFDQRPYD
ncbi:MAG TPA: VOC family protein [Candidatus Acidoferrum sp.]|nr:VOC family protein [Candidatus Acidoferrum sp.]